MGNYSSKINADYIGKVKKRNSIQGVMFFKRHIFPNQIADIFEGIS